MDLVLRRMEVGSSSCDGGDGSGAFRVGDDGGGVFFCRMDRSMDRSKDQSMGDGSTDRSKRKTSCSTTTMTSSSRRRMMRKRRRKTKKTRSWSCDDGACGFVYVGEGDRFRS
jgi:hypothetical protein